MELTPPEVAASRCSFGLVSRISGSQHNLLLVMDLYGPKLDSRDARENVVGNLSLHPQAAAARHGTDPLAHPSCGLGLVVLDRGQDRQRVGRGHLGQRVPPRCAGTHRRADGAARPGRTSLHIEEPSSVPIRHDKVRWSLGAERDRAESGS